MYDTYHIEHKYIMTYITSGLHYYNNHYCINNKKYNIHLIVYEQNVNPHLTLLISKVSEAIKPLEKDNHIGEGDTMDNFIDKQKGVRFIINGGFSHYRKDFYDWNHQNYQVGDPVGIVKIRDHRFEDYIDLQHYGFLIQEKKRALWNITTKDNITQKEKYILGCTPLLIFNSQRLDIPYSLMTSVPNGTINPPSILGHGLQNHPRTAVGMKNNSLYFIIVEGHDEKFDGCTLLALQEIGLLLELDSLLNLDGGGSSQYRLITDEQILKNKIRKEDEYRILGHTLVIFDETLK